MTQAGRPPGSRRAPLPRTRPRRFVAVAGNIGVGKTTMLKYLCSRYGLTPFEEPDRQNPYLPDFYQDMGRWAFHSQVSFLAHKFRAHIELQRVPGTVVQDRTIYEDAEIFARHLHSRGLIADRDWETYRDLYAGMKESLEPPDLLIYLECSMTAMRRRIRARGRPEEMAIPPAYLRGLQRLYEEWIGSYELSPVLVWQTDRMNYLTDLVHRIEFTRALQPFVLDLEAAGAD
ncbi:deoxynucleoside kinase [Myxococcota bacterium]|nr:deoxynucleoside kinase [Myxococcota bacterium]